MRFLSVCSGIEAASVAWQPLGWKAVAFSEIEPFPCAVLAHHYPEVPNWGDMTNYKEWPDANVDLLCGGTPCQSFSAAGLRKGLDDPRGNLMLTFGVIADKYRPRWLVWENVPGVLSSNGGRDFGTFLGMLGQLGYGFAYRVLDAQYFGVPQRRRRVFVVGYLGDWRRAAAVLFERHSLSGHPAPSREARKVAPTIPSRSTGGGGLGTDFDCDGGLIARAVSLRGREGGGTAELGDELQNCLRASGGGGGKPGQGVPTIVAFHGSQDPDVSGDVTHPVVGWDNDLNARTEQMGTLLSGGRHEGVMLPTMQVRRLTPEECEALQGFPRSYTAIPWRGKPADQCPDGPRYKALGNSWAVPVAHWIGERIQQVEEATACDH